MQTKKKTDELIEKDLTDKLKGLSGNESIIHCNVNKRQPNGEKLYCVV